MRAIYALALTAAMAVGTPAFAQQAGAPGAAGTGNGLTGSNPPGSSGTDKMKGTEAPMVEQRATAPDAASPGDATPKMASPGDVTPNTVRGEQNGQPEAK